MRERIFSRQELYDLVWAEPMTLVAKRLGLSGRGLAKACARGDIPVPERGYWQKLEAGQKVASPKLPVRREGVPETVRINLWPEQRADPIAERALEDPDLKLELALEVTPELRISVPTKGAIHPLARDIERELHGQQPDKYGVVSCQGNGLMRVRVAPGTVPRAVAILNALFKAVEARAWKFEFRKDTIGSSFSVRGEEFHFAIEEHIRRIDHVETEEEKAEKQKSASRSYKKQLDWSLSLLLAPKWDFVSTGEIALSIQSAWHSEVPSKFRDTRNSLVETRLNDVMISIRCMAAIGAARSLERRIQEDERRKREAIAAVERLQREAELARRSALLKDVAAWRQAEEVRAYVKRAEVKADLDESVDRATLTAWSNWARRCADEIDPLQMCPWNKFIRER